MIKWFKRKKKEKPVIVEQILIKPEKFRDYKKLEGRAKLIADAVDYAIGRMDTKLRKNNFNIYKVTEEKLLIYKNGFKGKKKERHDQLVAWMASIGLDYYKDRGFLSELIRGIYAYNNTLDFRNKRMRNHDMKKEQELELAA